MRILLIAALVAVGVLVGAAVPPVSSFVQGILASAGLNPSRLTASVDTPVTATTLPSAGPTQAAADGHDHGKPETKEDGHAHGEHAHSEAEGEEGYIKMSLEQVENQDIKMAKTEGGTISRHILVPGTITPDADRIARVPARVVGTVAEMRKRLGDAVQLLGVDGERLLLLGQLGHAISPPPLRGPSRGPNLR